MGLMQALITLGAGTARGYRASQETTRQLAEASRKAIMEQEMLNLKRAEDARQARLVDEQILGLRGERERGEKAFTEGLRPVRPSGRAGSVFKQLGLPEGTATARDMSSYSDIIRELIGTEGRLEEGGRDRAFREKHPDMFGGRSRTPKTKEERMSEYFTQAIRAMDPYNDPDDNQKILDLVFQNIPKFDAMAFPDDTTDVTPPSGDRLNLGVKGKGKKKDSLGIRK